MAPEIRTLATTQNPHPRNTASAPTLPSRPAGRLNLAQDEVLGMPKKKSSSPFRGGTLTLSYGPFCKSGWDLHRAKPPVTLPIHLLLLTTGNYFPTPGLYVIPFVSNKPGARLLLYVAEVKNRWLLMSSLRYCTTLNGVCTPCTAL